MRIVAGKLRHRNINMTNLETTRETMDKIRGAIFNMIGPYFSGGNCLDLFTGSGAMAIEAYSRGMDNIYLNDLNKEALKVAKDNCSSLKINDAKFYNLDYKDFCKTVNVKMDLIILDPPYKMNDIKEILGCVIPLCNKECIIVFEMAIDSPYVEEYEGLELWKNKEYGNKRVVIYRR
jgi:16S rRNA (guanine966-N2)-methyltransferase